MTYKLTIYKLVKNSNVLFNCEHNEDLIEQIDKENYSYAIINQGAKVTYTISSKGHQKISNTLVMDKNYDLTPELKSYFIITVNPNPSDAKVVLNYDGKSYEQNKLEVLANTPVQYVVSKEKYDTISETVMLNGDQTFTPSLIEKINSDYGISKFENQKSDKLSDVTLVSEKEYLKMSKKQRSNYIRFDPWLHSYIGADVTKAINDCLVDLYWSLPIVNKLAPFTNGTVKFNGTTLLTYLAQINSVLQSAKNIKKSLSSIQKAANKVGLGSLIGILTMAFKLIGGLAGMVYAILYNPQVLLRPYQQMFENYDIKDLYDRTIGTTIPNLEYVKANLNRIYFPDRDVKDTLFGQIKQIDSATQLSASVLQAIQGLEELVNFNVNVEEGLKTTLELLSTMGLDWALGELAKSVTNMKLEYDDVVNKINNNELSQASEEMMKNINGIMNNMETKYIKISDLEEIKNINDEIKKLSIEEYQKAYEESLLNAKNGETEEQMELKLEKYKLEMDEQSKDSSSFIEGYRKGHEYAQIFLDEEKKNLDTELKKESYQKGYQNGYAYAQQIRADANNYLSLGKIYGFIDIDNHIHNYNYQPIGRIDGDKVLSFPDEQIIGSYNDETKELIINSVKYNVEDNIIINESIEEEITEDKINELCEYLYKLNLIMVERGVPENGYINPYYSSGWKDGFKYKDEENKNMHIYVEDDENGETNGYNYAKNIDNSNHSRTNEECDAELFAELDNEINNSKMQNPSKYVYYAQGLIRGANDFQSEYNEGYSNGWWISMIKTDYDIYYGKNDYRILTPIVINEDYKFKGYTKSSQIIKNDYLRNYQILGYIKNNNPYNFDGEIIGYIEGNTVYNSDGGVTIKIGVIDDGKIIDNYNDFTFGYTKFVPYYTNNNIMGYINKGKLIYSYVSNTLQNEIIGYVKRIPYYSNSSTIIGYVKWDEKANQERIYQTDTNNILLNSEYPYYISNDIIYNNSGYQIGYIKEEPYNFSNVNIGIIEGNDVKERVTNRKIGEIVVRDTVYSIGDTPLTKDNFLGVIIEDKIYNSNNNQIGYIKEEPFDKEGNDIGEIIHDKKFAILKDDYKILGEEKNNNIFNRNDEIIAYITEKDEILDIKEKESKLEFLSEYCENIGTTIEIQESKPYTERNSLYRGWCEGWVDKLDISSIDYKSMYNNDIY